jgi:Arc/MetJ-type ribon-helix-helix transcriptional regulator
VVRDGLRLLQQRNAALEVLRAEVREGLSELDRGKGRKLEDVAKRVRARRSRAR